MAQTALAAGQDPADAELLAIRSLIEETAKVPETHAPTAEASAPRRMAEPMSAPHPAADRAARDAAPFARHWTGSHTGHLAAALWARVRTYRPERKKVLLTSLVLMLLLQPWFVFGWTLFGVVVVVGCYFALGGDAFWRRVVASFQIWERRQPEPARRVKLRAFAFSKKWERFLSRLPDGMADCLQLPELRGLLVADARHDAALAERFNRLNEDASHLRRR